MSFTHRTVIRFAHVDAAGIVFYPRYFELLNAAVEDWFAEMGRDFRSLHLDDRIGTPTVSLACEFVSPSRLGDPLSIDLFPTHIGTSSCRMGFIIRSEGATRVTGEAVLVCIDLATQASRAWPKAIAAAMRSDSDDGMA